jgi:hypothetical protein
LPPQLFVVTARTQPKVHDYATPFVVLAGQSTTGPRLDQTGVVAFETAEDKRPTVERLQSGQVDSYRNPGGGAPAAGWRGGPN